jgi:hypothetical protein
VGQLDRVDVERFAAKHGMEFKVMVESSGQGY